MLIDKFYVDALVCNYSITILALWISYDVHEWIVTSDLFLIFRIEE